MASYQVTASDQRPLPDSYATEHRHLGYDEAETTRPFAHFFRAQAAPIQDQVRAALDAGPAPARDAYEIDDAARHLSRPGYEAFETGYTRTEHGTLVVACHTDMPRVTAAMWDWWFGWHSTDSARNAGARRVPRRVVGCAA